MSKPQLIWEKLGDGEYRAKVLGGWLVKVHGQANWNPIPMSICFVPDEGHCWKGQS